MYISRQLMDKLRLLFINHKNVKKYCCRYTDLPGQYLAGRGDASIYNNEERRKGQEEGGGEGGRRSRSTAFPAQAEGCAARRLPCGSLGSVRDAVARERQHRAEPCWTGNLLVLGWESPAGGHTVHLRNRNTHWLVVHAWLYKHHSTL